MNEFLTNWQTKILSLLRIVTGFLILWHGGQKLFNFPPSPGGAAGDAFMIFGGIVEFGGGLLIVLGLFTRWAAFLLSGMMAVAYWMVHGTNGKGFLPIMNGGELAALYCFVFLYFVFVGGGAWSLDNLLKKKN
jgi:putative oxidoreductase